MKPATPLPWKFWDRGIGYEIHSTKSQAVNSEYRDTFRSEDATYIVHACNAYPKLVEAAINLLLVCRQELDPARTPEMGALASLLRELGELK